MHRRSLQVLGLSLAGACGYLVAVVLGGPSGAGRQQVVLAQVRPLSYTAELDSGKPLRPIRGGVAINGKRAVRVAFWSQPAFAGVMSRDTAEILIEAGRGEALEAQLGEAARKRLDEELTEVDRDVRETAILAYEEMQRTKSLLHSDPKGHVIIRTVPREKDPLWPRVVGARQRLYRDQQGAVVQDVGPADGDGSRRRRPEVYYFVEYARWPVLKTLQDDYNRAVRRRLDQTRRWIAAEFERRGMAMFRRNK